MPCSEIIKRTKILGVFAFRNQPLGKKIVVSKQSQAKVFTEIY